MTQYEEPELDSPMPFSMVEKMMPMYPMVAVIAWMIVGIAFLVAFVQLAPDIESWYSQTKPIREADATQISNWREIHVLETWIANFKFFGLGLGLMAITMALGTIARRLRTMGYMINTHLSAEKKVDIPPIPKAVRVFQASALMGIMILLITMILGFVFAYGVVTDYFSVTQKELNSYTGNQLNDLAFIQGFHHWLPALRMLGMGFLLTAITIALTVIINTLKLQNEEIAKL